MNDPRILVVDDDDSLRRVLQVQLEQIGYSVAVASNGAEALSMLRQTAFDLVVTDMRMPGMSGLDLLKTLRGDYPEVVVIVLTAFATIETAVDAMKAGAFHYITKPVHPEELRVVIGRALEHVSLLQEVRTLRATLDQKYGFENIIGRSDSLLEVLDMAARAAQTDSTVLIHGETGTGKELIARAIHFNSRRKDRPCITINCGAIPAELLESELFGHRKGAFTGAMAHKKGKIETADGGTLFLDEIGELPLLLQVKLLRLLQQGEIEKVGGTETTRVDVRVIAATHRNLQAMVEDGTFRQDLYYRLAVIPLTVPPLRERPDDIPELVSHLFVRIKEKQGRGDLVLPSNLLPYFTQYRWPGNVRELENVLERIAALARNSDVTINDLPDYLRRARQSTEAIHLDLPAQGISLESVERELILQALQRFNWNQTQAAKYLDLSRKTLIYRMEKHRLQRPGDLVHSTAEAEGDQEAG
ncbi:MAG TPA: sigma-54 dependent transcriptional regulator [Bryobacteraceae bacterium]|nr:sigma-54 dependent transcriptional regulator [Bryobacteraceae bacterium]